MRQNERGVGEEDDRIFQVRDVNKVKNLNLVLKKKFILVFDSDKYK